MFDLWLAAILDSSLKGLVLLAAAGAVAWSVRRSSAGRHLVWRLAFAGLLALPLLSALLPDWRVAIPDLSGVVAVRPAPARALTTPSLLSRGERRENDGRANVFPSLPPGERGQGSEGRVAGSALAFGIWLVGVLTLLAGLGAAWLRSRWQRRLARPVEDQGWIRLLARLQREMNVRRPVEMLEGDDRTMPMTWGWRRPVVLLPAGADDWSEPRRRAVLLHELAHISRGDYLTQLVAEVICALYWFNPLVWLAARRLRIESEHACDDQVLAAGARASDYAGDLLDIARSFRTVRALRATGLTMARPSQMAARLLAVLDARRNRRGVSRRLALPAWLATGCLVLPLAAFAPLANAAKPRSVSIHESNGTQTFSLSEDGHKLRIRSEGKVELTDDWSSIARLSRGAEMRIQEEVGGVERRLDIEAGSDGRPVYTWMVDGEKRPFDAEGRKWLQAMLLRFVRGTGFAAEERVASILKSRGAEGVLAEISLIPTNYGKHIYFERLFARRGLAPAIVERALRQAGKEIDSDFELRQTLTAAAGSQDLSGPTAQAYAEAARSIDSDFEMRSALSELIEKGRLGPKSTAAILLAAQKIDSDFELAELLTALARKNGLGDPEVQRAYAAAVDKVESSFERHRALGALVDRGDLSPEAVGLVLQLVRGIDSDFERASVLVEIAEHYPLVGAARNAYLDATTTISSLYERERAEAALGRQRGGR